MKSSNNKVTTALDKNFFDNIFEPKRRQVQKQLGLTNLSQIHFSAMIKDIKIKVNLNRVKQSRKFGPKIKNIKFRL